MKLYRSILFVPGNRPEWMDKAPQYKSDALIIDLEDSVPIAEKARTRPLVREGIARLAARGVAVMVRVNGVETGLTGEDVEAIVQPGLVAIMVPKLESVQEVRKVDAWIELFERKAGMAVGTVKIVVLPETTRGVKDAYSMLTACARVGNICGASSVKSGDYSKALGYQWTREGLEMLYSQQHTLLAARAAGVEYPIIGPPVEIRDKTLVVELLRRSRQQGYRGALLIHPSQVEPANAIFAPSLEEIEWNRGVLLAMAQAEAAGRAAVTYDGMMIDYAHVRNALDLLDQARTFGLPVGELPEIRAL